MRKLLGIFVAIALSSTAAVPNIEDVDTRSARTIWPHYANSCRRATRPTFVTV